MAKQMDMSRRTFLKGSAAVAAAGALGAVGFPVIETAQAESAQGAAVATNTQAVALPVTQEVPLPESVAAPAKTEYECDVLVIGGGFAGLNAADSAREAGQSVVLVDKGTPGYSGLTPFVSSHRWFDKEMGDDEEAFKACINRGSEYIGDMDWYQVWINESKAMYQRLMDWGILTQYETAAESGFYDSADYRGYHTAFASLDRRTKFMSVLSKLGIPVADQTMITNVVVENGAVKGAMGLHVPSSTVITFHAKAVVMAMGGGAYKPTGFPTGQDTFDGEYICYNLGLPIGGKEFDDFHMTCSQAPGNAFLNNNWTYLNCIWLCGGDITADTVESYADGKGKAMVLDRVTKAVTGLSINDGTGVEDLSKSTVLRKGGSASENPNEVRKGKRSDTMFKGDVYGAAVGFGGHLSCGVFCGLDDLEGKTSINGLYVAGDGMNCQGPTGAAYPTGVGFTSSFCSIQGDHAGKAAAAYAEKATLNPITGAEIAEITEEILAPLSVTTGFDPNWARDMLEGIMAPYWVLVTKNEANLSAALTQVLAMKENVIPKLAAATSHDLRLVHEMRHKVQSAEMKLRASLARKETRGLNYRSDYPYRDDENFLCYMLVEKQQDGSMSIRKQPVKDEWKGDLNKPYAERYGYYFPGEREAKGLPEEQSSGGWGK